MNFLVIKFKNSLLIYVENKNLRIERRGGGKGGLDESKKIKIE